jgi:septum formation protein
MSAVLVLASASPRRSALLTQIGVAHEVQPARIDERCLRTETAEQCVLRLARQKALEVQSRHGTALPVLGADTAVVLDDEMLGKPSDRAAALAMLARLSGRTHTVLSAVAVASAGRLRATLSRSEVRLRSLSSAESEAYWASGEPADKAGAYAIQGLGAVFVQELRGSYSGVMGLPLFETADLLAEIGVSLWSQPQARPGAMP